MSEVENFCPYMCDRSSMCFWKCYNFRKFSGHVKLNLSRHLGAVPPDPHFQILPGSPITSVSGPGVTMLLVTPLQVDKAIMIILVRYMHALTTKQQVCMHVISGRSLQLAESENR